MNARCDLAFTLEQLFREKQRILDEKIAVDAQLGAAFAFDEDDLVEWAGEMSVNLEHYSNRARTLTQSRFWAALSMVICHSTAFWMLLRCEGLIGADQGCFGAFSAVITCLLLPPPSLQVEITLHVKGSTHVKKAAHFFGT